MTKKTIIVILLIALCLTISSCGEKISSDGEKIPSDGGLELRAYTYQDSNKIMPASLTLLENNRFQFDFSVVSSYRGVGSYSIDNDMVLLTTDDGDFHYTFTITEDGLVFDAVNSSKNIWFGDFTDGSVFQ